MKFIASCSCGKDSLAMVYKIIEEQLPLDEIVFYDTGMEFQAIYHNWEQLSNYAAQRGIKCVTLRPKCPFSYMMFEHPHTSRKDGVTRYGYSWCGGRCRWGTTEKLKTMDAYCERNNAICYVGIAADEDKRLTKERKPYKRFPLVDWDMSEADCLAYCRQRGLNWKECCSPDKDIDLYDILDRVSCWCCANKNLHELYNIWRYLPEYWDRLRSIQTRTSRPFNGRQTIFQIQKRFEDGYIPRYRKQEATISKDHLKQ